MTRGPVARHAKVPWTHEEDQALLEYRRQGHTVPACTDLLNRRFGTARTKGSVSAQACLQPTLAELHVIAQQDARRDVALARANGA